MHLWQLIVFILLFCSQALSRFCKNIYLMLSAQFKLLPIHMQRLLVSLHLLHVICNAFHKILYIE